MAIAFEAYTVEGMLTGSVVAAGRLPDLLGSLPSIVVESATYVPIEGPIHREGRAGVAVDDLLLVTAPPETITPVYCAWHGITLELGPFRVHGLLPSMRGFNPARALARPTGPFVLIGHVTVELRERGRDSGVDAFPYVFVNRYAVESVESDIELGFFFPGAHEIIRSAGLAD